MSRDGNGGIAIAVVATIVVVSSFVMMVMVGCKRARGMGGRESTREHDGKGGGRERREHDGKLNR